MKFATYMLPTAKVFAVIKNLEIRIVIKAVHVQKSE